MTSTRHPEPSAHGLGPSLLVLALLGPPLAAQIDVQAPIGLQPGLDPAAKPSDDPGRPPRMLESTNVDRFLRRAQEALSRGDHRSGIRILQDVVEGRTLELLESERGEGEDEPTAEDGTAAPVTPEDDENAVFSTDGRLFRPVRRLCQELLAALPPESIDFYRTLFELDAERALDDAVAAHDVAAVEQVFERWFVTETAARAMQLAGDMRMDAGSYRAAIRDYELLLEVYPAAARTELGVDERWLRFKVALCLELLGDGRSAREELEALRTEAPDGALRIAGELRAVGELAEAPWFDAARPRAVATAPPSDAAAFRGPRETLVPLFEHRFVDGDPYRPARGESEQGLRIHIQSGESVMSTTPRAAQFAPGTTALVEGERIAVPDHFRVRISDLPTGRAVGACAGPEEQPAPRPGVPRVRIAAYDQVAQRVVSDGDRYYCVVGPGRRQLPAMQPVLENELCAYSRESFETLWTTESSEGYADVTFLAAPTIAGDRLLVPTARRGIYGLECVDARTGAPVFHVPLHAEGTEFARPIAPPAAFDAGMAYVLTGAGGIGAVDVHTGTLRWVRRYERVHPLRPRPRVRPRQGAEFGVFGRTFFREEDIPGFAPSDLVVHDGLVIAAPCDGEVLLCLDGATGEPQWMLSRDDMQYVLGTDGEHLYVGAPDGVYCIGLRTGVRLWRRSLPPHHRSMEWRGRGTLTADVLALPGDRGIHVLPLRGKDAPWTTVEFQAFGLGREPLDGRFNLQIDGPWVVAVHAGGVQVFSTVEALQSLADSTEDPLESAGYLAQLGDLFAALAVLESVPADAPLEVRDEVESRAVAYAGELALAMASHGERESALATLERCRAMLTLDEYRARWRLERIEVFRALGDLDAVAREQDALVSRSEKE